MKKNKYLLLGSSLASLLLLVTAAGQERLGKEWRRIQGAALGEDGSIPVQLRQIVNPALRLTDRCVSCHVSMAPGEQGVRGAPVLVAHKPVVHDPAEYGCTVCHGGQGLATDKPDAHGDVHFWPEPMLPPSASYAGCGTCHAPLGVPNSEILNRARLAFERLDCRACHRVDGRGGTIRPDGGGMEGPDLSRVGATGYDVAWYAAHLRKHEEALAGAWKISFAPVSDADLELVKIYLATRVAAPALVDAKAVFHSTGCLGCHKVSGVGGDEGPDLSRAGEKDPGQLHFAPVPGKATVANWLSEHFRSPAALVAGSQMPAQALSESEIERLTFYVLALRRRDLPGAYLPRDRIRATRFGEREFSTGGATLFGAFCTGCHGDRGQGLRAPGMPAMPAIANTAFLELASDAFLEESIKRGRPGRRMPAWAEIQGGLRSEEITRVVAYLRESTQTKAAPDTKPPRWLAPAAEPGARLYAAACSGCHGAKGEGGEGPALNNPVLLNSATDTYLVETVARGRPGTAMAGFLEPSPVRPALARGEIESVIAFVRTWERGKK